MNCATVFVKYFLFFINLIMALAGMALVSLGIILNFKIVHIHELLNTINSSTMSIIAISIIVVGTIFFTIASFACCGAVIEKRSLIMTYAIILLGILIFELVVGGYSYYTLNNMNSLDDKSILITKTKFKSILESQEINMIYHVVQMSEECCGIFGVDDYLIDNNSTIPISCCPENDEVETCEKERVYEKGCLAALREKYGSIVLITLIVIGTMQIIFIVLSFCLVSGIKNSRSKETISGRDYPTN